MVSSRRLAGAAAGLALDRVLGEPPLRRHHPVALFGAAAQAAERRLYADSRLAGALYAVLGAGAGAGAGAVLRSPAAATYLAASGRALHKAAGEVALALGAGELDRARSALGWLVGRDPSGLDGTGVARAAVESVAENTVDAIVAPALWAAAGGGPGVLAHRAADTLDSMVGYRDRRYRRYGWAAARLDDAMAWLPARVTAVLVAAARPNAAAEVLQAVRTDAPAHPSPNAGVAEAAFAAALGLRLGGGTNRYGEVLEARPVLGRGRDPGPGDIARAVALSRHVTWLLAGSLAAGAALRWRRERRHDR